MASERVEQAYETAVDALVDWSAMPPGRGFNVRDILDDFEAAVRAEAVAEWREAVREWAEASEAASIVASASFVADEGVDGLAEAVARRMEAEARLRALLEGSQEEADG